MVLSSKFDSLSVRPPTPPKDLAQHESDADETLQFLDDPFGVKSVLPKVIAAKALLNTPEQSPSSDILIPSSSASRRKRVNFELQSCAPVSKRAIVQSWTPSRSSPLRPLPQTRVSKPLKSILKPSDGTPTPPPADNSAAAHKFNTFADMLESIVKLLASADRSSRLDAYHSLQRTMQAYEHIPDEQALKHKMSLLTQFIRRDIQAASPTGTGLDSQLIAQALRLLMALFRVTDLTSAMDDEFCSFIVDRVISVASDKSMSKSIVNNHLAVFMQQNFRPKTMNPARTEKILDVLDTITERVSGFSVQAYRIRIYRKLIQQRPDIMIRHTERWFKITMKALVSGQKDMSQSALDFTISAAKAIGHDRHVAQSVLAVLNRVRHDGDTVGKILTQEMEKMLEGDNAAMVPQIWSAVTGLLRDSLQGPIFSALKEWLKVFEKCFMCDKDSVKVYTNVAFCFLLYAVNLGPNTSETWMTMLVNIPLQQVQRRGLVKKSERDAIASGYVTLLYYALRPTSSFEQLDRYWKECVAAFWNPLVHLSTPEQAMAACRVVSALLNGSRKPWNEHRALDLRPQAMIQRGELPLVDPRWVRRSLPLVLQFVETLLDATSWTENELQDEPVKSMWLSVMSALVDAGKKEVMASSETKDAMAHIVNLLRRVWDSHTAQLALPQQKEDLWEGKFCFLIETVVQQLGPFQFADKCLTRNNENTCEVASTPSHRSRQIGVRISPLLYFVDLLINQSEGKLTDSVRHRALKLIVEPCFTAQNGRLSRLEILRDCGATVTVSSGTAVVKSLWAQLASLLKSTFQGQATDPNERVSRAFGKEYEVVVNMMGLGSAYMLSTPQGHEVLSGFIDTVRQEVGDGGLILAVIEKVSECVLKRTVEEQKVSCLSYANILLRNLPKQMSRRVLDQGRQNLWPSSPAAGRHPDFDPYNHLYGAVVSVGTAAYQYLNSGDVNSTRTFISALALSIRNCSTSHLAVYLRKTQEVVGVWVEDPEKKLQNKEETLKGLHHEVVELWQEVNKAIERLPRKDGQILLHLETLIAAGFLSRRRSIVNISIRTWNSTFGKEESLRYPSRLEHAVRRLRNIADILLPSLEIEANENKIDVSFYDSDVTTDTVKPAFKSPRVKEPAFKVFKAARASRSPTVPSWSSSKVPVRRPGRTPRVRLRHDNSQIMFEPIVSSPSNPFNQESQVLTERQQDMVDHQRLTKGLFSNMGAMSSTSEAPPSPMEFHSDALSADDLPNQTPRTTPLKALAAMGPMDVFLGSSPTPHTRKSTPYIANDDTSVATPTAIRNAQFAQNDDLGSSPPRFGREAGADVRLPSDDVQVDSTFAKPQVDEFHSFSFEEGTTIDEEALLEAAMTPKIEEPLAGDSFMETTMLELPSSNIDLQLIAQIDADMQAHQASTQPKEEAVHESHNVFVDAASHQLRADDAGHEGSDAEVEDSQLLFHVITNSQKELEASTSSTSRVGDSFIKPTSEKGTPKGRSLRRSSRHSLGSSPIPRSSGRKSKQMAAKMKNAAERGKTEVAQEQKEFPEPAQADEDDGMFDNIVVASPKKQEKTKKRKSMGNAEHSGNSRIIVPETSRKFSSRRSQSLLSQVESSQDVLVKDTPAPKRPRQSLSQDVSEIRNTTTPPKDSQIAQTKRLSHVQITPRRSSELGSSTRGSPAVSTISKTANPAVVRLNKDLASISEPIEIDHSQQTSVGISTPSRSFTERVILTPRSILNQLKSLKDFLFNTQQLVLGRDEEREIDDALFDIRTQVHAAGRRGEEQNRR